MRRCFAALFLVLGMCSFKSFAISYSYVDCNGVPFDEKILKFLNFENGVFIEVGANDGLLQSNTKLLEEAYGWTGILIEPSPLIFPKLLSNRPYSKCFQCAVGSFEEDGTYVRGDFDGGLMSSVGGYRARRPGKYCVLMRSLQSILDEVGIFHINFFSLDVEGYELNVLKGIDFEKTQFDYLLIEIYTWDYEKIVNFLSSKGYEMIEPFSNYTKETNPGWDGTHNDYLFKRKL